MSDTAADECAVCTDAMGSEDSLRLPGCGHRFHVRCVMNFCRYNTRCPICRRLPEGVETHAEVEEVSASPRTLDAIFVHVRGVVDVDDVDAQREWRREWQRYRVRRRRELNRNPRLNAHFERLQLVRREIASAYDAVQRRYARECRELWRVNPELGELRRILARLQCRERRLKRTLRDALRALLGSEP